MQFSLFMDKYPTFSLDINKAETKFTSVDEIIAQLEQKVAADPIGVNIAVFDHFAHTTSLAGHEIDPDIKAAKNLIFCFGIKLPSPLAMAPRPRSFGVCELSDRFVVSFMEPPNPQMNELMKNWCNELLAD